MTKILNNSDLVIVTMGEGEGGGVKFAQNSDHVVFTNPQIRLTKPHKSNLI